MVKTSWGNVKTVKHNYGHGAGGHVEVVGCRRKPYTRNHPYPTNVLRIKPLPREKAAIRILNRLGYRTQEISKALGRSTSFIWRTLRQDASRFTHRFVDMRKLPHRTRLFHNRRRWTRLMKYWNFWEAWIQGEGEKPP